MRRALSPRGLFPLALVAVLAAGCGDSGPSSTTEAGTGTDTESATETEGTSSGTETETETDTTGAPIECSDPGECALDPLSSSLGVSVLANDWAYDETQEDDGVGGIVAFSQIETLCTVSNIASMMPTQQDLVLSCDAGDGSVIVTDNPGPAPIPAGIGASVRIRHLRATGSSVINGQWFSMHDEATGDLLMAVSSGSSVLPPVDGADAWYAPYTVNEALTCAAEENTCDEGSYKRTPIAVELGTTEACAVIYPAQDLNIGGDHRALYERGTVVSESTCSFPLNRTELHLSIVAL